MTGKSFGALLEWRPQSNEAVNAQITRFVRELLVDGLLDTSSPMPSMHELARQWGTNYFTVQSALSPLVKQGLLTRRRRLGTFACPGGKRLRSVGIFFGCSALSSQEKPFYHLLLLILQQRLSDGDISCKVFFDQRPEEELRTLHPAVGAAIDAGEIQALIVSVSDMRLNQWLSKLAVPTSFFGTSEGDNRVWLDNAQFAALAMGHLAAKGRRSVGFILPFSVPPSGRRSGSAATFISHFPALAAAHGLRMEEKWILSASPVGGSHQKYGYETYKSFAALSDKPDSLIVFPDDCARGVVAGILETGVPPPGQLEIVFHKNEGIDLFCPFPVSLITNSPVKIADALIDLIKTQFEGKPTQKSILPFSLTVGP